MERFVLINLVMIVFKHYFAVINKGGAWIGYYNLDEIRFIEVDAQ